MRARSVNSCKPREYSIWHLASGKTAPLLAINRPYLSTWNAASGHLPTKTNHSIITTINNIVLCLRIKYNIYAHLFACVTPWSLFSQTIFTSKWLYWLSTFLSARSNLVYFIFSSSFLFFVNLFSLSSFCRQFDVFVFTACALDIIVLLLLCLSEIMLFIDAVSWKYIDLTSKQHSGKQAMSEGRQRE